MQTILIAGAGKSSIYLIQYILANAPRNKWKVIVADGDARAISEKIGRNTYAEAVVIDITNASEREPLVKRADIVVSLMPPQLHIHLAKDCLKHRKNLITSSYISPEMKEMDKEVREAGLMFMCEMGLDPGIDHMTASKIIHSIHRVSGIITGFSSYCGGLIAPESDNNPWHYKFTWNPKNVITAGRDGASYLIKGKEVDVKYERMFEDNKKIKVNGLGSLAYYPNRDSLHYRELYDVPDVKTFLRATLRHPVFCKGWDALIRLGLTDTEDNAGAQARTYAGWLRKKIAYQSGGQLMSFTASKLNLADSDKVMGMLQWLGLFEDGPIPAGARHSSDILLALLLDKWKMAPGDIDMVVMQHDIEYMHKGSKINLTSSMVLKGEDEHHSAMAKSVGLPMGVLTKLLMTAKVKPPVGVLLPVMPAVYRPVLTELAHYGISFSDEVV